VITSRRSAVLGFASFTVLGLAACSSTTAGSGSGGAKSVSIVGFSTPKPAYDDLEAAFKKTSAGTGASFSASFGPSGSQSKAVAAGQPADYVGFSVGSDMEALVPDFVASGWNAGATKGIVAQSVVVIVTRKGNPKKITGWDDIVKSGIKIVTPDPQSSGSAKWNILAAYQHAISAGGTTADAEAYLKAFFTNAVSKPDSGSDAMTTFLNGTGDVLVSYESEAITARQAGNDIDYVVPDDTVLIQTPGAVTKKASASAKAFLAYVLSVPGQQLFAKNGWRPAVDGVSPGTVEGANDSSSPFPTPTTLTTVESLGGWSSVNTKFFDADNGISTKIENAVAG
jgi:ABC-type sulfate transport system substrate-binding protein